MRLTPEARAAELDALGGSLSEIGEASSRQPRYLDFIGVQFMQMTADSRATTTEVIAMLQRAVHAAIQDYSVWSGGHILDGSGAERMMQVYAATRLFEVFNPRYGAVVHLEVPFSRLLGVTTNNPST